MEQLKGFGGSISNMAGGLTKLGGGQATDAPLLAAAQRVIDDRDTSPLEAAVLNQLVGAVRSQDNHVKQQGLLALVIACENDKNKLSLVAAGGMSPVIEACGSSDHKMQYSAARVLWFASKLEENRVAIIQAGGLEAAEKVISSEQSANQYAGLRVVLHMCESPGLHKTILGGQIPYALIKLLGSPTDQVAYVAASSISYLAETDPEHAAFLDDGFIGTLSNCSSGGSDNTKYAAFSVVRSLNSSHDTLKKLASSGLIEALVENMSVPNERLQYISMATLATIPVIAEEKVKIFVQPALTNMSSERPSVVSAAARLIKAYLHVEDMRDAIVKKNDYFPFINALKAEDFQVQAAGALALNAVLKDPRAAEAYVSQGGIATLAELLGGSEDAKAAAVQVLWPVSFNMERHGAINEQCLDALQGVGASHADVTTRFLACLVLSALNTGEEPVGSFTSQNKIKVTELDYVFSPEDGQAISDLYDRTHGPGQLLATWAFAHLSKTNSQGFLRANGYEVLDKFASTGASDVVELATSALNEIDLTEGLAPKDASELLDFFLGDIKQELEMVEKLKAKHTTVEKDLRVRYRKRENIDKLHMFQPQSFVSQAINDKLARVPVVRQQIDTTNAALVDRLEQIEPLIPPLEREIDVFRGLSAKEEDKERIRSLKEQLANVNKQISETAKKLDGENTLRENYEGEKRTLVARLNQKSQVEANRIQLVAELEDVQYQIDNYDAAFADMEKDSAALAKQKEELEAKLAELRAAREELLKVISASKADNKDWERKLSEYEQLRKVVQRFKLLRKEVKEKYGEELTDLAEFHALLGGLMNTGYTKLRELSGEETPRDEGSAFTKENVNRFLDFGSKAEVELDERVSELYSELEGGLYKGKKKLKDEEDQLKVLEGKIEYAEVEVKRMTDKIGVANLRKSQMPTKEQLGLKKKECMDSIEKLDKELQELSQLEPEIEALNKKIEEQAKTIAHDLAHKRKLQADVAELERQLNAVYQTLEGDLNKFAEAFSRFKKARAALQSQLRPLMAETAQWKKLFAEEKAVTLEAWTALNAVVSDIQVVVNGITNAKEDVLFVDDEGGADKQDE